MTIIPRRALAVLAVVAISAASLAADEKTSPAELVQRLGAARYADRESAAQALETLGPEALPILRAAEADGDAEIRRRAVELARRIEITWMIDVREVLAWLPADTETLLVARGPFPTGSERLSESVPIVQLFQLQACGVTLDPRLFSQVAAVLPEVPVKLAVEGSRRFRGRVGPFSERYEGCHLILYREDLGPPEAGLDTEMVRAAARVESVAGHPVAVFEGRGRGRFRLPQRMEPELERVLYVTWVRPDTVAIAGDRGYLAELITRVAAIEDPGSLANQPDEQERTRDLRRRAFPDDLPEWDHVIPTSPVWALRHFRGDKDDPTSPRSWPIGGRPYTQDAGAVGLVAWVDESGNVIEARYLSDHPGAIAAVRPFWTGRLEGEEVEVRQADPGVVAIRLSTTDDRSTIYAWFTIATALGHPPTERW